METKKCTSCGIIYPATLEYFHKSKSCKGGLNSRCKGCVNKKQRENFKTGRYIRRSKEEVEREKREELVYRKMTKQPYNKGIGDKLDTVKLSKDKKYRVERRKNEKNQYEFDFEGIMVQDTKDLVILRNKKGYCSTYRKADILCGDYKIKEA